MAPVDDDKPRTRSDFDGLDFFSPPASQTTADSFLAPAIAALEGTGKSDFTPVTKALTRLDGEFDAEVVVTPAASEATNKNQEIDLMAQIAKMTSNHDNGGNDSNKGNSDNSESVVVLRSSPAEQFLSRIPDLSFMLSKTLKLPSKMANAPVVNNGASSTDLFSF